MAEMNQYLYTITPTRMEMVTDEPTEAELPILSDHLAYLQDLKRQGTLFLAGRTQNADPTAFGIVIFQAKSAEAAQAIMKNDPAVKHHLMKATLFPYQIAVSGNL